jgi:hypothetical protein
MALKARPLEIVRSLSQLLNINVFRDYHYSMRNWKIKEKIPNLIVTNQS